VVPTQTMLTSLFRVASAKQWMKALLVSGSGRMRNRRSEQRLVMR
jgi:hypothetical protein